MDKTVLGSQKSQLLEGFPLPWESLNFDQLSQLQIKNEEVFHTFTSKRSAVSFPALLVL